MAKRHIELQAYHGVEATVNAYIFSDNKDIILVDCLRNSEEAGQLAAVIKKQNKPLSHILITHGHPDHYLGMRTIKNEFPDARIVVTTQEIKNDIIGFSGWMENVGWLEKEPAMKPKSPANPNGFDYENEINVLSASELQLAEGAVLELDSKYEAAECDHLTTIYSKDLNVFLANDFIYHGVHPWLAIDKKNIAYWKTQLGRFKSLFAGSKPTIYPGHGQPATVEVFDSMKKYIEDFEATVAACKTRQEAMETMKSLYPEHKQADFLLLYSVNAFISE
jgi:glyoxylase-like metal-dependent hydrolase (beta-lactamase superfamily II)